MQHCCHVVSNTYHIFPTLQRCVVAKSSLRIVSRNITFMDYVNKQRRNWFLFLNLNMVPRNSTPGGFAWIWQSQWVGTIAMKTERTQIHFLSGVLVDVASLDLNVEDFDSESRIECQWLTDKHVCESHSQLETVVKKGSRRAWQTIRSWDIKTEAKAKNNSNHCT